MRKDSEETFLQFKQKKPQRVVVDFLVQGKKIFETLKGYQVILKQLFFLLTYSGHKKCHSELENYKCYTEWHLFLKTLMVLLPVNIHKTYLTQLLYSYNYSLIKYEFVCECVCCHTGVRMEMPCGHSIHIHTVWSYYSRDIKVCAKVFADFTHTLNKLVCNPCMSLPSFHSLTRDSKVALPLESTLYVLRKFSVVLTVAVYH